MTEQNQKNILIENIGGYVVKVGSSFVSTYKPVFSFSGCKAPKELVPYLNEVKEVLHDKGKADYAAKKVNGKIYRVCVEPVEDKDEQATEETSTSGV